jgi:hypothetical protein
MYGRDRRLLVWFSCFLLAQCHWQNGKASVTAVVASTDSFRSKWDRRICARRRNRSSGLAFVNQMGIRRRKDHLGDPSRWIISSQSNPGDRDATALIRPIDEEEQDPRLPHQDSSLNSKMSEDPTNSNADYYGTTWTQFMEEQKLCNPSEWSQLEPLLNSLQMACRIISLNLIGRAPFIAQRHSLERLCTRVMQQALLYTGQCHVTTIVSTKDAPSTVLLRAETLEEDTKFVSFITPLLVDASSTRNNHDILSCGSGTLFSIYRRGGSVTSLQGEEEEEAIGPSKQPLVSGYVLYGSSTQLIIATTTSLQGFTLNIHNQNEFICTRPNMVMSNNASHSVHLPSTTKGAGIVDDRHLPSAVELRGTTNSTIHYYRWSDGGWVEQPGSTDFLGHLHRALSCGGRGGIWSVPVVVVPVEHLYGLAFLFQRAGGAFLLQASRDGRRFRSFAELPPVDGDTALDVGYFGGPSDIDLLETYMSSTSGSDTQVVSDVE